jgi:hypothetical protein
MRRVLDARKARRPGPASREFWIDLSDIAALAPHDEGAAHGAGSNRSMLTFMTREELAPDVAITSGVM